MAKIVKVKATLTDALDVRHAWETIPDFKMGNISLTDYLTTHDAAEELHKQYAKKDLELTGLRKDRDDNVRQLQDLITRFRFGVRSSYGSDSMEYALAGGTPASARKSQKRKAVSDSVTSPQEPAEASRA